ncbi:CoA-binding protein [Chloroflexales bacterium ZM16-3]|nr:CoA-binding protein [Chloroflexales bacterium ZM16-3]
MMSENEVRNLLKDARTIAIVGMSDDPKRDSNGVARFLKRNGYGIIPVNPNLEGHVINERPYASLRDIAQPVDVVVIFRRSEFVPEIVEDAIAIGARAVWMQLGVVHNEAAERAKAAGIPVTMDRCMAIEHRRLMRGIEPIHA